MPEIEKEKSIIPLYKEDMMTAKENGEMADWRMSFKENCNCAKAIDKALNENYADNRLDTDKALDTVLAEYSAERVTHVLAAQVVNHDWDGRYHNDVKAWAKEQTKELSAEFMEDSRDYYLNAHPILIDGLATTVMRKEKELENDIPKDPPDKTSENDVAEPPKTFTKSKDKVKEITDKLESGIKELFEGEKFKEYLDTMSKFHNYSFNNTMLIAMQKPDATLVAGFNSWKNKFERSVNKGEKGIQIFAPAPYKIKKEQTKLDPDTDLPVLGKDGKPIKEEVEVTIPAFKVVSVFDVSQTSGKELPTLGADELSGNVKDYEKFFNAVREASPVPIKFAEIDGTAKGFYHHEDKSITIKENMSEVQTIKTAIHEIAHAKLHDRDLKKSDVDKPKDRSTEEVEAESIAYTVCQHFGIDTSDYSFAYVASWGSGKDTPELKSSLETIRSTASELITAISDKYLGLEKDKTQEQTADKSEKSNIIGNTAYADIEDKQYLRLKSSTAEKVAEKLTEQNIPFSGRINGDKTTLTISKANIDSYKAIIAEVTGKAKETPTQEQPKAEPEQKAPKPKKNNIIGNTAYPVHSGREDADLSSRLGTSAAEGNREIRTDEKDFPDEQQERNLSGNAPEGNSEQPFDRDRRNSEPQALGNSPENGERSGSDRGTESDRPDGLGGNDEQSESSGRGNNNQRTDLQLNENEAVSEMNSDTAFSMSEEKVLAIINHYDEMNVSKQETLDFFLENEDGTRRADFIKAAYGHRAVEFELDGEIVGYRKHGDGLEMWEGSPENSTMFSWDVVQELTASLIDRHEFIDLPDFFDIEPEIEEMGGYDEPIQLSLFGDFDDEPMLPTESSEFDYSPASVFTQDMIDYVLRAGSNEPHSLERIVAQFEKNKGVESNAEFLRKEFGTDGRGFLYESPDGLDKARFSAWYDKDGITIGMGETAFNRFGSVSMTWEQVSERISELLNEGRFATQDILKAAEPYDRKQLADKLWYLHQDVEVEYFMSAGVVLHRRSMRIIQLGQVNLQSFICSFPPTSMKVQRLLP